MRRMFSHSEIVVAVPKDSDVLSFVEGLVGWALRWFRQGGRKALGSWEFESQRVDSLNVASITRF